MNSNSKAENLKTDVVIIGGGGCGLAAAVTAAEKGAKVILLEKKGAPGGNTALAIGLLAAESPAQKRLSISAPRDEIFRIAMDHFHWRVNARLWRAFVDKSGDTIQWLEDSGLKFKKVPSFYPGQTIRTWHCADEFERTGPILVKILRKQCEDLGVRLLTNCPAKKILTDGKGGVTGVLAAMKNQEVRITAKSVIISTGGYGGNKELLKKYHPSYSDNIRYVGVPHVTGDGLLMATDIGAATEGLGTLMTCMHVHWKEQPHVGAAAVQPATVWVNKKGERFVDETLTFHCEDSANAVDRQPDNCVYSLFDEKIKNRIMEEGILTIGLAETGAFAGAKLANLGKELQSEADKEWVKISNSWDDIAKWMELAPQTLKATIEEYNSFCDQGYDAIFAKDRRYLQALRTPPYYAVRRYPSLVTTIGGIKINHRMEVLNNQDDPIFGLYAGGDTTGGWEEYTYNKRLSGSALGFAINSGRIAGENAAEYVLGK